MSDEIQSTDTTYRTKLYDVQDIPPQDELIQGTVYAASTIDIKSSGEHKRGTLMVGHGMEFSPASAGAILPTDDVCILSRDVDIPDGMTGTGTGYFSGTFKASSVILPYETEEDDHMSLIEEIRGSLRHQKIFLV